MLMRKGFAAVELGQRCTNACVLVKLARIIFYPELCSPNERMAYDSLRPLDTFILSWTAF